MNIVENWPSKNIYVVLGVARSGTSVITRGLKALGIDLGENLISGTKDNSKWNPKGFWEDSDIVYKINRSVIYAVNDTWSGIQRIDHLCKNNDELLALKKKAIGLLQQRMASVQYWGFKDPKTARILPFWQEIFSEMNLNEHYVIALRNPLSTANSWHSLDQADVEVGLMQWITHLVSAIEGTLGKKRVMVSYDMMLQDPRKQLERIKAHLDIPAFSGTSEIDSYSNEFLDKKLSHYDYDSENLRSYPDIAVAPLCVKMYELFLKLAADEIYFNSAEFLSAWKEVKDEFNKVYPIYSYLDKLLKKNKELERELQIIHKSIPWKLVYPLRFIDDKLRYLRRKSRGKRRLSKSYGT